MMKNQNNNQSNQENKFVLTICKMNQVLKNIQIKRRGINIDKKDLMSAVARGCYVGKMPLDELTMVINVLVHEGYIEVLNDRIYIAFDYIGTDAVLGGYVHWNHDYQRQTANIRAFDAKQKAKKEVK